MKTQKQQKYASNLIHGMEGTPTYRSWASMKYRCLNPKHKSYHTYKDVVICDNWMNSFVNFFDDMGVRPEGKTLGRIDNNKGYSSDNCQWETPKQQANNRKNNRVITFGGKTMNLCQWAELLGLRHDTLSWRLKNWTIERALTK